MTDWMQPPKTNANVTTSVSMSDAAPAEPAPTGAPQQVMDISTADFKSEVIDASSNQPVLVDFWAPWCGPCKQLGPILEKAVAASNGAVRLVKMDIEKYPDIAGQMGIQSIPAVVAFVDGKPADAFMGAKPESEVQAFIDKLAAASPAKNGEGDEIAAAMKQAEELIAEGDHAGAAEIYSAVLTHEPGNLDAIAGLGQCYMAVGETARARALVDQVPTEHHKDQPVAALITAVELAEKADSLGDIGDLAATVEKDPKNHQARFDYALALNARDQREEATEQLIMIIRTDRKWNDDGARAQLVEFFDVWGNADPATISGRRSLSSVLFS
mgnify:CR=1 FL=1